MRKFPNLASIFRLAIMVICATSALSITSLSAQESASKKIPTAVQRDSEPGAVAPSLPENPAPRNWEQAHGHSAGFFTFRSKWTDPPLRSNKQLLKSKFFWISEGSAFASMAVACHRSRISGEEWHSEAPAQVGVLGLNYVYARFFSEAYLVDNAWVIQHYVRASIP